ncbi:MAG: hypothetical protein QW717_06535 [Candidatus Bathyarchaeia archaeon]
MPNILLRPHPSRFDPMRIGARAEGILRVYGQVKTMQGKRKRISFGVKISRRMMRYRRNLFNLIVATCNSIKLDKTIPVHKQGEVFSSFGELFEKTDWVKVRKVEWYKVGVKYER